jgi:YfiH family protein
MSSGGETPFLTVQRFERVPGLVHGFGTRAGTPREVAALAVREGYRVIVLKQIHSDLVLAVDDANVVGAASARLRADALVTALPRVLLVVKTADCLPVLLVSEARRVVAAVHCGWRGTLRRVLDRTLEVLAGRYGASAGGLLAALGPCIGGGCYEVGDDVRSAFAAARFPAGLFQARSPGRYLFDLRAANVGALRSAGLPDANIVQLGSCTHCDPRLLSFRRDRDRSARMASFIGLV